MHLLGTIAMILVLSLMIAGLLKLNYKDLVPPNIQLGNLTTWEEVRYAANQ